MIKCNQHPKYLGTHKPRISCKSCYEVFKKQNKIKELVLKEIGKINKILNAAKDGLLTDGDQKFIYVGDLSDYMYIYNLILKSKLDTAYSELMLLDTNSRESFPDNIYNTLEQDQEEIYNDKKNNRS